MNARLLRGVKRTGFAGGSNSSHEGFWVKGYHVDLSFLVRHPRPDSASKV